MFVAKFVGCCCIDIVERVSHFDKDSSVVAEELCLPSTLDSTALLLGGLVLIQEVWKVYLYS